MRPIARLPSVRLYIVKRKDQPRQTRTEAIPCRNILTPLTHAQLRECSAIIRTPCMCWRGGNSFGRRTGPETLDSR